MAKVNGYKCKRSVWLNESGGKNTKSMWWNDKIKAAVRRKEAAWKEVLAANDEEAKERFKELYREEKRKVKRYIYQNKKTVNEQFGKN